MKFISEHALLIFIIGAFIAMFVIIGMAIAFPPKPEPCESFSETDIKNIPARCYQFYGPRGDR